MATVHAAVRFETDKQGKMTVVVESDDELARATLTKALEEFFAVDRASYYGANEAKWRKRFG